MKAAFTIKMWNSSSLVLYWIIVTKCLCTAQGLSFISKWPSEDQYTNDGFVGKPGV